MDYTTKNATKMRDREDIQDYLSDVRSLLVRHKLVEDLVHRQDMPHHDLVETLVHKQNMVELQRLLDQLDSQLIARILTAGSLVTIAATTTTWDGWTPRKKLRTTARKF